MGYFDSIYTVYQAAAITIPTAFEALTDRLTHDAADRRLQRFARRVVENAEISIDIVGAENVPDHGAFVFMSNHQSHFDIPVLYYSLPIKTLRMVAKAELFRVPLWGRAMRAGGMIEIDRSNRESAIASLGRAAEEINSGISIWIAPEGSRTSSGELGPLKKGGFYLARDTGTPIIPVALSNTGKVLPRGTLSVNRGVAVDVVIGAPIATQGREIEGLMDEVREFLLANIHID
jgi:1-acyl-sn-glycerol-3-phosphate acyltransferase